MLPRRSGPTAQKKVLLALLLFALFAQASAARAEDAVDIKAVLQEQVAAWNRGDVDGFMVAYKNSPETTFIGKSVEHGYGPILARYKRAYPTREKMGTLDFSELSTTRLGADFAVVTGRFHLARSSADGGEASGIFSLVWEKTPQGWKIILDHTSSNG